MLGQIITSHVPLINILLSHLECQGCKAPLRGFALDAPRSSAVLLAGGMRNIVLISVFSRFPASYTDSRYTHGSQDARHISISSLCDLRY